MRPDGRRWQKIRSAAAVLLLHLAAASLVLFGFGSPAPIERIDRLAMFDVPPTLPPPEPEVPEPRRPDKSLPSGQTREILAEPTPVVAPTENEESPLLASPVAGMGEEPAGGGSGRSGNGAGAGGMGPGGGVATPARKLEGLLSNRDYPRSARRAGAEGRVVSRLQVGADGRVQNCSIRQSSGHDELDRATCRLIGQRFRFAPARNEAGVAVPDRVDWETIWWLGPQSSRQR